MSQCSLWLNPCTCLQAVPLCTVYPSQRPAAAVYEWIRLSLEAFGDIISPRSLLMHRRASVLVHLFTGVHNHGVYYKGRQRDCITDPLLLIMQPPPSQRLWFIDEKHGTPLSTYVD